MAKKVSKSLMFILLSGMLVFAVAGCNSGNPVLPGSATIYLQIANPYQQIYSIYIDGEYMGKTNYAGAITIYNVTPGNHFIDAYDQILIGGWYGGGYYDIVNGPNYIDMTVYEMSF